MTQNSLAQLLNLAATRSRVQWEAGRILFFILTRLLADVCFYIYAGVGCSCVFLSPKLCIHLPCMVEEFSRLQKLIMLFAYVNNNLLRATMLCFRIIWVHNHSCSPLSHISTFRLLKSVHICYRSLFRRPNQTVPVHRTWPSSAIELECQINLLKWWGTVWSIL